MVSSQCFFTKDRASVARGLGGKLRSISGMLGSNSWAAIVEEGWLYRGSNVSMAFVQMQVLVNIFLLVTVAVDSVVYI